MTSSTASDAALAVAHALSRASEEAIGSDLVAVILHGSLASGDFAARASDIDLLVVTRRPLADDVKSSVVNTVMSVARGAWLDYRVVASSAALRPALVPTLDLAVGIHPDAPHGWEIERGPTGEPDLLFEFA